MKREVELGSKRNITYKRRRRKRKMETKQDKPKVILINLGYTVGKLRIGKGGFPCLTLFQADEVNDEGFYIPAKSITLCGESNLLELVNVIQKALQEV